MKEPTFTHPEANYKANLKLLTEGDTLGAGMLAQQFGVELKMYLDRMRTYQIDKQALADIIWGQCSSRLVQLLESEGAVRTDPLDLLRKIRNAIAGTNTKSAPLLSIISEAFENMVCCNEARIRRTMSQGNERNVHWKDSLKRYYEEFKATFAVLENLDVVHHKGDDAEKIAKRTMTGYLITEKFAAMHFLNHSDRGRQYCCANFKNVHLQQGSVNYPDTIDGMYNYLLNYRTPGRGEQGRRSDGGDSGDGGTRDSRTVSDETRESHSDSNNDEYNALFFMFDTSVNSMY